jgi:hypothetical protein
MAFEQTKREKAETVVRRMDEYTNARREYEKLKDENAYGRKIQEAFEEMDESRTDLIKALIEIQG